MQSDGTYGAPRFIIAAASLLLHIAAVIAATRSVWPHCIVGFDVRSGWIVVE